MELNLGAQELLDWFLGDMEADEGYGMEEEGSGNVVHHVHHGVFEAATLEKLESYISGSNKFT